MILSTVVSVALAVSPLPLAVRFGGQPEVEAATLGDLGTELGPKVAKKTAPILEEAGFDASTVRISMGWLNAAEFHYAIKVALDPATPLGQAPLTATCRDCSSEQLVEAAAKGVRKAIENEERRRREEAPPAPLGDIGVESPSAGSEQGAEPESDPGSGPADETLVRDDAGQSGRGTSPLRPLGWAGIGAMGAGVAAMVTGGVFVALGERRPPEDMSQLRDFRPSGYGLLGAGGVLVVAGAIMLGVERAKSKTRGSRARVVPVATPRRAGVVLRVRF